MCFPFRGKKTPLNSNFIEMPFISFSLNDPWIWSHKKRSAAAGFFSGIQGQSTLLRAKSRQISHGSWPHFLIEMLKFPALLRKIWPSRRVMCSVYRHKRFYTTEYNYLVCIHLIRAMRVQSQRQYCEWERPGKASERKIWILPKMNRIKTGKGKVFHCAKQNAKLRGKKKSRVEQFG